MISSILSFTFCAFPFSASDKGNTVPPVTSLKIFTNYPATLFHILIFMQIYANFYLIMLIYAIFFLIMQIYEHFMKILIKNFDI